MTATDDFIAARRAYPWPDWNWDYVGAPAGELHANYKAAMIADDRRVLTANQFGAAVVAAGFERTKRSGGYFYPDLTLETRLERARAEVVRTLRVMEWHRNETPAFREYWENHWSSEHAAHAWQCDHRPPPELLDPIKADVDRALAALEADGTIAGRIEEGFGPYLRWRPGEPNPGIAMERERKRRLAHRAIEEARAVIAAAEPRLRVLRAEEDLARERYGEAIAERSDIGRRLRVVTEGTFYRPPQYDERNIAEFDQARASENQLAAQWVAARGLLESEQERVSGAQRSLADALAVLAELDRDDA
ncbi:MAG TPA: hypothetical protein VFI15_04760 [Candidatus Limnocylindrales bacterium]|nr:hypothetical protein [Candidatus Limnocylindrales bacterium]